MDHDGVGADFGVMTNRDRAQQLRARTDRDTVLHGGMTFAGGKAGTAQGHTLIDRHILSHRGRLSDDHTHAVVDEQSGPDIGGGMDLNAGDGSGKGSQQSRQHRHPDTQHGVRRTVRQ